MIFSNLSFLFLFGLKCLSINFRNYLPMFCCIKWWIKPSNLPLTLPLLGCFKFESQLFFVATFLQRSILDGCCFPELPLHLQSTYRWGADIAETTVWVFGEHQLSFVSLDIDLMFSNNCTTVWLLIQSFFTWLMLMILSHISILPEKSLWISQQKLK